MSSIWTFLLIWGVWLITPVLVDGAEAIARLIRVSARRRERAQEEPVRFRPRTVGISSIGSWGTVYYMMKVGLALVVDRIRPIDKRFARENLGHIR